MKYTNKDIIEAFKQKYKYDIPTTTKLDSDRKDGKFICSVSCIFKRFGSYSNFIKECGLGDINKKE